MQDFGNKISPIGSSPYFTYLLAYLPVSQVMIPVARLHVVSPQQSLNDVLPLMAGRDVNQLPVVQNGTLVGILSRDAIIQYLEVRRSMLRKVMPNISSVMLPEKQLCILMGNTSGNESLLWLLRYSSYAQPHLV